jgi:type IV pilus assembly protein PilW
MAMNSIRFKQYLLNSDSGFTVAELLVSSLIGLMIAGMTLSVSLSNRGLFQFDLARTKLNQNLRSSLDVIGLNIRQAGENLPLTFPAVEIVNGADGAADELVLRRNLLDEILKVCQPVNAGSSDDIFFAIPGTTAGCVYSDQLQNQTAWQTYRLDNGGSVRAYVYDPSTGDGEFFDYDSETDTGTSRLVSRGSGSWENDYSVGTSAVYLIEEWRFRVDAVNYSDPMLQLIINGDENNPQNVIYGITNFQVTATMEDDSELEEFGSGSQWVDLKELSISITGEETSKGEVISRTVRGQFFPRNVLSN